MQYGITTRKIQFKIYTMFLFVKGQPEIEKLNFLDTIRDKLELDKSFAEEVLNTCKQLDLVDGLDYKARIMQEIDGLLETLNSTSPLKCDPCLQAETIWNLINLGYAGQKYSESEDMIVAHLKVIWEIDSKVTAEFRDTANTILMLVKQKDWLKVSGLPYDEITDRLNEVDKQINLMYENVKVTISQMDSL